MKTTRRGFLALLGGGIGAVVAGRAFSRVKEIGGKEGRYPLLFTTHEGGRWQQWPSEMPVTDADLAKRSDVNVLIGSRRVHSLRFWERKGEFVGWRRWDCVNGWNRVPQPATFMPTADSPGMNEGLLHRMTEDNLQRPKRRKR